MLVPADSLAGAKGLRDFRFIFEAGRKMWNAPGRSIVVRATACSGGNSNVFAAAS